MADDSRSTSRQPSRCGAGPPSTSHRPAHRGGGLGRALLAELAAECAARGLARLEWSVLDWNAPSIGFYRALGAVAMDEWTVFRLDGAALATLGRSAREVGTGRPQP